jgi:hypothetical protein
MIDPLAALADIELPDAPGSAGSALLAIVIAAAVVALSVAIVLRHRQGKHEPIPPQSPAPGREARRRLDALHADWLAGELDDREAAYRICAVLRIGLHLAQLMPSRPPPHIQADEWAGIVERLQILRYRPAGRGLDEKVFERIAGWLAAAEASRG